jgi:hypothetical protein
MAASRTRPPQNSDPDGEERSTLVSPPPNFDQLDSHLQRLRPAPARPAPPPAGVGPAAGCCRGSEPTAPDQHAAAAGDDGRAVPHDTVPSPPPAGIEPD